MDLRIVRQPVQSGRGRPRISGTILASPNEQMVIVRRAFSGAANEGNTGSQPVEVWVAVSHDRDRGYRLHVVRRAGGRHATWHLAPPDEWQTAVVRSALDACHARCSDPPRTIWDHRVILPDDPRWPKGRESLREWLTALLCERSNACDDNLWAIDAAIIAASPRIEVIIHAT